MPVKRNASTGRILAGIEQLVEILFGAKGIKPSLLLFCAILFRPLTPWHRLVMRNSLWVRSPQSQLFEELHQDRIGSLHEIVRTTKE